MPRRAKGPRVVGVYPKRRGWRVIYVCQDGQREEAPFETKGRAERYAKRLKRQLAVPIEFFEVLEHYRQHLQMKGNRRHSINKTISRLEWFLGEDMDPVVFNQRDFQRCYVQRQRGRAADTHRRELGEVKTFLRWCHKQNWLVSMTLDDINSVEPVGRKRSGPDSKRQLRIDEARRWLEVAMDSAAQGNEGALGASLSLLLGLRNGEIRGLETRDVDDGGRLLWVNGTKSKSARRKLEVPPELQPLLLAQVQRVEGPSLWKAKGPSWVYKWTRRICRQAEVPEVCPHSMRGLHASLAREAGSTGEQVAAMLGHSNVAMHEQAYADRSAMQRGQQRRALSVITGGIGNESLARSANNVGR